MEMVYIEHLTESLFKSKSISGGVFGEKILRPCFRNKNSVNKKKRSYFQIEKTVSIDLDIYRGEAPNTKRNKIMVRNNI